MLFVFLSHFGWAYFKKLHLLPSARIADRIGKVASPTFIIISGLMLGYLYHTHQHKFETIRDKLFKRGMFMLTVGHFLIYLAHVPATNGFTSALRWTFITDVIAFCIILGPILVERMRAWARVMLGVTVYVLSWFLVLAWHPDGSAAKLAQGAVFGAYTSATLGNFPILPWLGVYLASSAIGEYIAVLHLQGNECGVRRLLLRAGGTAVALATIASAFGRLRFGRIEEAAIAEIQPAIYILTNPFNKVPPAPAYLLFYGGIGLLIIWALWKAEMRGWLVQIQIRLAELGQTSLFVFMLQYYVYFSLIYSLPIPVTAWWPAIFIISVFGIFTIAHVWHRKDYNRFIAFPISSPRSLGAHLARSRKSVFRLG